MGGLLLALFARGSSLSLLLLLDFFLSFLGGMGGFLLATGCCGALGVGMGSLSLPLLDFATFDFAAGTGGAEGRGGFGILLVVSLPLEELVFAFAFVTGFSSSLLLLDFELVT